MIKKLLALGLCCVSVNAFSWANTDVKVYGSNTLVNNRVNPEHDFWYGIQNNTHFPQTYTVTYSLCATNQPCAQESFKVNLASTQSISKMARLNYGIIYRNKGNFNLVGTIKIEGESTSSNSHSASIRVNL